MSITLTLPPRHKRGSEGPVLRDPHGEFPDRDRVPRFRYNQVAPSRPTAIPRLRPSSRDRDFKLEHETCLWKSATEGQPSNVNDLDLSEYKGNETETNYSVKYEKIETDDHERRRPANQQSSNFTTQNAFIHYDKHRPLSTSWDLIQGTYLRSAESEFHRSTSLPYSVTSHGFNEQQRKETKNNVSYDKNYLDWRHPENQLSPPTPDQDLPRLTSKSGDLRQDVYFCLSGSDLQRNTPLPYTVTVNHHDSNEEQKSETYNSKTYENIEKHYSDWQLPANQVPPPPHDHDRPRFLSTSRDWTQDTDFRQSGKELKWNTLLPYTVNSHDFINFNELQRKGNSDSYEKFYSDSLRASQVTSPVSDPPLSQPTSSEFKQECLSYEHLRNISYNVYNTDFNKQQESRTDMDMSYEKKDTDLRLPVSMSHSHHQATYPTKTKAQRRATTRKLKKPIKTLTKVLKCPANGCKKKYRNVSPLRDHVKKHHPSLCPSQRKIRANQVTPSPPEPPQSRLWPTGNELKQNRRGDVDNRNFNSNGQKRRVVNPSITGYQHAGKKIGRTRAALDPLPTAPPSRDMRRDLCLPSPMGYQLKKQYNVDKSDCCEHPVSMSYNRTAPPSSLHNSEYVRQDWIWPTGSETVRTQYTHNRS